MEELIIGFFKGFWIIPLILTFYFIIVSFNENEKKAAYKGFFILIPEIILVVLVFQNSISFHICLIGCLLLLLLLIIFLIPFKNPKFIPEYSKTRFDERDIIFSRNLLVKGSARYNEYYKRKPEFKEKDDLFRSKPGILQSGTKFYDAELFSAADAAFAAVESLQPLVDLPAHKKYARQLNDGELSEFIMNLAKKSGAVSCGITKLESYHLYSHVGRGGQYGEEVSLNHNYAIAFTVEMDKDSLSQAPYGPAVLESANQYLNAGKIAIKVAEFVRNLGFEARAHIDANYRVICPLVAQDAGLGIIGRMGLLMTPELGPRVRIGVVTTNASLNISPVKMDGSMIEFCRICKKCASSCPVQAISFNEKKKINGAEQWKINSELCFTYWCTVGTDCGKCMSVCPYSHPDNFLHSLVRKFIQINPINRWLALNLDNFIYGKKIEPSHYNHQKSDSKMKS
ncbi:MAG: 4Fe-4S dicluster domain-containing protein [Mariniphaga sp.]|nr:4Fe-4S dicluster domain-containing protein [Mariniphaga sp.]